LFRFKEGFVVKIGNIECQRGERVFGYLEVDRTASELPISIPINILCGPVDGPTLVVDAAIHGNENVGCVGIGQFLRNIDVSKIKGTVIAVPVVNTSGYEFGQREVKWDGKDLNRQGGGDPNGTPAQRLAYAYFQEVVSKADAFIDIHSGGQDGHVFYTFYEAHLKGTKPEVIARSRELGLAFGLEDVFCETPWPGTFEEVALKHGIPSISVELGGGSDWRDHGQEFVDLCERGIRNVMALMGMLDEKIVAQAPVAKIWRITHEVFSGNYQGFFLRNPALAPEFGMAVKKGDVYGMMYHPFTGAKLGDILIPDDGHLLHSARLWPVIPRNRFLTIIGDLVEKVELAKTPFARLLAA
jgi:hypothetical protein